tara:strand:- start:187 stop:645 length:459 start_codon:yes stop_codon:yes gene_type:complete
MNEPMNLPHSNLSYHEEDNPPTKLEIISLVASYYGEDPSRRGIIREPHHKGCVYTTDDGHQCAVGLFCDTMEIDEGDFGSPVSDWEYTDLEDILYPAYRGHGLGFWECLQLFHDCPDHFDAEGLSDRGKKSIRDLSQRWEDRLNPELNHKTK